MNRRDFIKGLMASAALPAAVGMVPKTVTVTWRQVHDGMPSISSFDADGFAISWTKVGDPKAIIEMVDVGYQLTLDAISELLYGREGGPCGLINSQCSEAL